MNHASVATLRTAFLGALAALLGACATTPENVPELEQARSAVQELERQPGVQEAAAQTLSNARTALERAETALEEGEIRLARRDGGAGRGAGRRCGGPARAGRTGPKTPAHRSAGRDGATAPGQTATHEAVGDIPGAPVIVPKASRVLPGTRHAGNRDFI